MPTAAALCFRPSRRDFGLLLGLGALAGGAVRAAERTFPSHAVRIMIPASTGSATDLMGRLLAQRLSDLWHQPVLIENQAGASGSIGAAAVARAPADGHTLMLAFVNHAINQSLQPNIGFDLLRDFKPVVHISAVPLVLVAHPSLPANNIAELIALAKSKPASEALFFGSAGAGSTLAFAFEMLKLRAGIQLNQTPYKGTAPMTTDILGNHIAMGALAVAQAAPHIKAGRLKALGVTTARRSPTLPDVPTVAEQGMPGYEVASWNGLLAPAATPDAVIEQIYADVVRVAEAGDFRDQLQAQGVEMNLMGPAEYRRYLTAEVAKWAKLIKDAGVKPE